MHVTRHWLPVTRHFVGTSFLLLTFPSPDIIQKHVLRAQRPAVASAVSQLSLVAPQPCANADQLSIRHFPSALSYSDANVKKPAREWSRGDASEIDGQAERPKRAGANESMLSELRRDAAFPASIVSLDWPFDNLGFLSEKFRQTLFYIVRSQTHRLVSTSFVLKYAEGRALTFASIK